ncbi:MULTISPECIES: stage V sporulation T C-terminal domain-containing protein [unclassified Ruminococcus]|uniref:stage V sporulation T C-terminal domain-containing protein n=1 Tax=unclassified Ruminococcus TaxID=2608920 RepID=UPI0021089223|nr:MULTISPECIES: stage V sporulation T C-terminal domain-containing protein [unclassified Ruminococcus]
MKATGIVRRIDDLGRVVIPKEIRRTLRIKEGAPLEIYTDGNGEVIFKKYLPMGELVNLAVLYTEVLYKVSGMPIIISDSEHIVAVSGVPKRDYLERRLSPVIDEFMETRRSFVARDGQLGEIHPVEGLDGTAAVMYPIISSGDVMGSVIMLFGENKSMPTETEIKLVQSAAVFLGKQMEE